MLFSSQDLPLHAKLRLPASLPWQDRGEAPEGAGEKPRVVQAGRAVTSASPGERLWWMIGKAVTPGKGGWPWHGAAACPDSTPNSSSATTIAVTAARPVAGWGPGTASPGARRNLTSCLARPSLVWFHLCPCCTEEPPLPPRASARGCITSATGWGAPPAPCTEVVSLMWVTTYLLLVTHPWGKYSSASFFPHF